MSLLMLSVFFSLSSLRSFSLRAGIMTRLLIWQQSLVQALYLLEIVVVHTRFCVCGASPPPNTPPPPNVSTFCSFMKQKWI